MKTIVKYLKFYEIPFEKFRSRIRWNFNNNDSIRYHKLVAQNVVFSKSQNVCCYIKNAYKSKYLFPIPEHCLGLIK